VDTESLGRNAQGRVASPRRPRFPVGGLGTPVRSEIGRYHAGGTRADLHLPPLVERPPPGKRRISCCRRPRPGSVRQGGRRSFSRRYRLMITLPGQRSTTSLKTFWSRLRRAVATVPSVRVYSSCRIPETSLDATLASLRANLRLSGRDGLHAVPLIYFPPGSKERKRATDGAPHER